MNRSKKVLGVFVAILAFVAFSMPAWASESLNNVVPWFKSMEIGLTGTGIVQGVSQKRAINATTLDSQKMNDKNYATYSIDFEVNSYIGKTGHAYMLVEAGNGQGPDQYYYAFGPINNDAIGTDSEGRMSVSELWYQQAFFSDMCKIKVGKVDLTDNFDTNNVADDEETQFLAAEFVNNPTIDFPDYCFAVTLWAEPTKLVSVGLAYADADADWNSVLDRPFLMAEVDVHPTIANLEGNYRFMAWRNGAPHVNTAGTKNNADFGFAISADQKVLPELTLFARWGWQDPDIINEDVDTGSMTADTIGTVENAMSAGFQLNGAYWGRDKDHVAVAYGWDVLSGNYRDYLRNQGLSPRDEQHVEAYYHYQLNDHVNICPDVQFVMNPSGVKENHNMLVVGIRGQVTF